MRLFSLFSLLCCLINSVSAQVDLDPVGGPPGTGGQTILWDKPFSSPQPARTDRDWVLMVITNDQPWPAARRRGLRDDRSNLTDDVSATPEADSTFWCQREISDAIRKCWTDDSLATQSVSFQSIKAGLPLELTGGEAIRSQAQAVVAICDRDYRLLSFVVGVPDARELSKMMADAKETHQLLQAAQDDPQTVVDRLADRSRNRLSRLFQRALAQLRSTNDSDGDDENHNDPTVLRHQIRNVSIDAEPVYLLDVERRFGLSIPTDGARLRVLEQHVETRRPWCELMLPYVAGANLVDIWQPLVESIWGHPPITAAPVDGQLAKWVRSQLESSAVVLMLRPPMKFGHLTWPPPVGSVNRGSVTWKDVHAQALEHPFRSVSMAEVSNLIRGQKLQPIDVYQPSLVRYLFLQPQRREPLVVREDQPPSRFRRILQRSESTLVTK